LLDAILYDDASAPIDGFLDRAHLQSRELLSEADDPMTVRAQGQPDINGRKRCAAPSVGDTLVLGDRNRTGQIMNLYKTLGTRRYVMVVNWVDTGNVGLVFPGPDVHIHSGARVPLDPSCNQTSSSPRGLPGRPPGQSHW